MGEARGGKGPVAELLHRPRYSFAPEAAASSAAWLPPPVSPAAAPPATGR